jgi:hypothetical protein
MIGGCPHDDIKGYCQRLKRACNPAARGCVLEGKVRRTAYGFLFHMEVTETIIKDLCREFRQELDAENISAASIIQKIEDYLPSLQSAGKNVFNRWAQLIRPV